MRYRVQSDKFLLELLNSVRFSPTSTKDRYISGIQTNGGLGGVGYSYWVARESLKLHEQLDLLRRISRCELSFAEVEAALSRFTRNFVHPLIAGQFGWQVSNRSLLECLSDEQIKQLQSYFYQFLISMPEETWFWFPLNSVSGADYIGSAIILSDRPIVEKIDKTQLEEFLLKPILTSATKYLGVSARSLEVAKEKASVFIGSLFLAVHSQHQFLHTMGKPAEGVLQFDKNLTYFSSRKHIPYLAQALLLESTDLPWIARIEKAVRGGEDDRKLNRALRWLHSAWFAVGAERFTLICQAMDALTPSSANSMSAKCNWIYQNFQPTLKTHAIELIFKKLRSDVMHGDAPSLIESSAYVDVHAAYGLDPVDVSVEIVRRLMIQKFVPEIRSQPHPMELMPDAIRQKKEIFGRYGMSFELPSEMDLSRLI